MSNVSMRERTVRIIEITVPNPATRRDVADLLRVADQKVMSQFGLPGGASLSDDAYRIEARDDELVALFEVAYPATPGEQP